MDLAVEAQAPLGARARVAHALAALSAPRDAIGLAAFRVMFGALGAVSAARFLRYGWIDELFVSPRFYFQYDFAPFVEPLGRGGMYAVFWTILVSSTLIGLGLLYRLAVATFLASFAYVQLIDVTNYLNHYYLVVLLALWMLFMPLGRAWSLDALLRAHARGRRRGAKSSSELVTDHASTWSATFPGWCWVVLRLQVGLVYFYAGIAKLTTDWLVHAQPLDIWLASRTSMPIIGPLLAHRWTPHTMSWAGFLFDTTIVGWLLWRRTRPFAFVVVVGFHALTKVLFPIGMFPFIMIVSATVFFDPSWVRRFVPARFQHGAAVGEPATPRSRAHPLFAKGLAYAAVGLLVAQLLLPLRTFLVGGNVHWHERGMRFSWRVMVREKNAAVTYLVENPDTGRRFEVDPRRYLDPRQAREFGTQPDLVLALGRRIARDESAKRGAPVRVFADVIASLNGRPSARLVDREIDLTTLDDSALGRWILPAPETSPPFLHEKKWSRHSDAP